MQINEYKSGVSVDDLQLVMQKTSPLVWQELKNAKLFLTGGTGFLGCWLLEVLAWANIHHQLNISVTLLTRDPDKFKCKAPHLYNLSFIRTVTGDVTNLQFVEGSFDMVIHAATDVTLPSASPLSTFDNITKGTEETLKVANRCGAKKYLLTSSGAVYGDQPHDMVSITEDYLGAPKTGNLYSAYGQGKRVSEFFASAYSKSTSIEIKIARCFALLGPYLPIDAHFAAGNFIYNVINSQPINIKGDGTAIRSYLYAADMIIWLLTILIKGQSCQPYNLGSDEGISIADLAQKISTVAQSPSKISIASSPLNDGKAQRYIPNISKAQSELNLGIYTDLDTAIRKTLTWHVSN